MGTIVDLLPALGLRITAGPLELRGITDDDLPALCDLVERGIHDPDAMPFYFPWTDAPRGDLALNQVLTLRPQDLVRGPHPLHVEGLEAFRRSIGLDDATDSQEQA